LTPDVLVVGGGCAGLAAATALAERGAAVRLLEARPVLGGRSRSWIDRATGDVEDNGQHLLMGCYDEFLTFVERTGGIRHLRFQDRLELVLLEPGGRARRFRPGPLVRPLDLIWGLLRLGGFSVRDLLGLSRLARELARGEPDPPGPTAERWLVDHGQSESARRVFWEPLILATLNLRPDAAPAGLLAEVLRRALLGGRRASRLGFPERGLGPLVVDPARAYLEARGGEVRAGAVVTALEFSTDGRFAAARARDGSRHAASAAVIATPHREAAALLGDRAAPYSRGAAEALGRSPIVAVHLWFDRPVSPHAVAGLLDSPIHWVFNRARIGGAAPPGYLALVTSAADGLVGRSREQLVTQAVAELDRFFPGAGEARLLRSRVLKERRATPALRPETAACRPAADTHVPNLALAGDWTDTGLPATLEGAAASGHRAARLAWNPEGPGR
jgi:squalene-associated FAD-dependent desaturase